MSVEANVNAPLKSGALSAMVTCSKLRPDTPPPYSSRVFRPARKIGRRIRDSRAKRYAFLSELDAEYGAIDTWLNAIDAKLKNAAPAQAAAL